MKVYISGQITGIETEAPALFEKAENELRELGHEPINPMKLPHQHDKSWESYMKEDLAAMMQCEAIYLLPNWYKSTGAKIENALAYSLKMKTLHNF